MRLLMLLAVFWMMQVMANVAFKYGSIGGKSRSRRWLIGFIGGNIVGASSIYFLMLIFACMPANPNIAVVLASVGGALGSQVTLAWLFRSRLSWVQWVGIVLATAGTAVATLGGR